MFQSAFSNFLRTQFGTHQTNSFFLHFIPNLTCIIHRLLLTASPLLKFCIPFGTTWRQITFLICGIMASTASTDTETPPSATETDAVPAPAAAEPAEPVVDQTRCSVRKCPIKGQPKFVCANPECSKLCHITCYVGVVKTDNEVLPGNHVACTKKCNSKAYKHLYPDDTDNGDDKRAKWEKDGKEATPDVT